MKNNNIGNVSDEALVTAAQNGDDNALSEILTRYEGLVRSKASLYYVAGADEDDVIQEGRIGLLRAIRNFDGNKNKTFLPFAVMCIKNQIMTAIKRLHALSMLRSIPMYLLIILPLTMKIFHCVIRLNQMI